MTTNVLVEEVATYFNHRVPISHNTMLQGIGELQYALFRYSIVPKKCRLNIGSVNLLASENAHIILWHKGIDE